MAFKPKKWLNVTRTLSTGEQVAAGVLAQNRQGVFFQYAEGYEKQHGSLSPFTLQHDLAPQKHRVKDYTAYLATVYPMGDYKTEYSVSMVYGC